MTSDSSSSSSYSFVREYFDANLAEHGNLTESLSSIDIALVEDAYFSMLNDNESNDIESVRSVYRWSVDCAISDHRDHRKNAYVPFRRFTTDNFAVKCGTVTKQKIQRVYDVIGKFLRDSGVCPCVIIYNLFVRDVYCVLNMRHNSLYNYVRVFPLDCNREPIVINYVEVVDVLENVTRLFRTINSQRLRRTSSRSLIKKSKNKKKLTFSFGSFANDDLRTIANVFVDHFVDCAHTDTRTVMRQLRSNDEAAQISVYCLNCKRYI